MANIKFTAEQWERAKEYYEAGLTLSQITEKTKMDKAAISRKAKLEEWVKNNDQKQQLIRDATNVAVEKSKMTKQALSVHDELVNEQTKQVMFFNRLTLQNLNMMARKLTAESSIIDHRIAQQTIKDGKEVVLGKAPDTAIQINQQNQQKQISEIRRVIVDPISST